MVYKCGRCGEKFDDEESMYNIDTPNNIISLCLDCAIDVEDDLLHLAYKTTTGDVKLGQDANCVAGEK